MNKYEDSLRIIEEFKKLATELDITIITARQYPRHGYTSPPQHDPNGIIIIDYIGLLR